jgi:hypothetical protein
MMSVRTVEDAYKFAPKAEEKLTRKQIQRGRGESPVPNKGKGVAHDKAHKSKDDTEKPHSHLERGGSSQGRQDGGRSSSRGRGRSRGKLRCYARGKTRHMSWECPEKKKEGGGEAHILEARRRNVEAKGAEDGTSLILRKVLLKLEAEVEKPMQRNRLFMTACKTKEKVCKVIIDSGSTVLAIILVMGSRAFGSASCTKCLSTARENSYFFQVAGQVSGQSVVDSIQGLFCEADQRLMDNCR